jgi:hypothetical protein
VHTPAASDDGCHVESSSSSSSIIPIESVATAVKVALSYKLDKQATEEQQWLEFGCVLDRATEAQKNWVDIRSEIQGHVFNCFLI